MGRKKWIMKAMSTVLTLASIVSIGVLLPAKTVSANLSVQTVVNIAKNEIGYIEKASDSNLDSKTANAGKGNYTKYGKDLSSAYGWNTTHEQWCDIFVDWCFIQAYGEKTARAMTYQTDALSAKCSTSMYYYQKNKHFYAAGSNPQKGDQIFFYDSNREVNHTGLVVDVNMTTKQVTYVDGNSGANTDRVSTDSISFNDSKIAGYGRPDFVYGGANSSNAGGKSGSSTKPTTTTNQIPTTTITDGAREYVATLYKKVLGRTASQSEIDGWALNLSNGGMTAAQVAKGFFESQEYKNKKTSNSGYVETLYIALLGRTPDTTGQKYWVSCLNNGWSRLEVLRGIVGSKEYKDRCKSYGITAGSV